MILQSLWKPTSAWRVILPLLCAAIPLHAQVNPLIDREVWMQRYGVLDAQMDQLPPYAGWLSQDADGDGVNNQSEFTAGTNPWRKFPADPHFRPPTVAAGVANLTLGFPTVPGKFYAAQSNATLMDEWQRGTLPGVTGDGTPKSLNVPMSAGKFFRISVTDQSSQGDQVSDWAKHMLGFSLAAPIGSQSSYDDDSLATELQAENTVTLEVLDYEATQPTDAATPADDPAVIRVSRSGNLLPGDVTVPLVKSGTAVEGTDYATLPASVVFPAGVNAIDIRITPLFNATRTSSATVFLTAQAPGTSGAAGNYALGNPTSRGATIRASGNPTGSGLAANYYEGYSSTYASLLNFGGKAASYSFARVGTTVTATVTYSGTPAIPLKVGNPVSLRFTSGNLNNTTQTTNITGGNGTSTLIVSFTSAITQTSGTGNCEIGNFFAPVTRIDPTVDFNWGSGSPDPLIPADSFSTRWTGQVLPQYSQKYYFVARVDDAVKLWVNNQLIVDRWASGSGDRTGSIDLQAGVRYDIRMEYAESTGSAEARLNWYGDDQAKQIIPMSRLFPTTSGSPEITSPVGAVTILGSGSPFSTIITASNGATITASGLPLWLTLIGSEIKGTPPAAGIYQFTLTATNAAGSGSSVMTLEVKATPGTLTRELWTSGVSGAALADVPWTSPPSSNDTVTSAEDDTITYTANTGERLRGYFTAPATGNYYFWIAASNTAELWISNNAEPVNKVRRALVTGPTGSAARTWNTQPGQKSQWLSLTAGSKYYIEALHNTGASPGSNHLSIAWFLDPTGSTANPISNNSGPATASTGGILPSHVLSPWDNPPTTTIPGTLYVTNLQGVDGLSGITATGGAFLRVNGSSAVLQLNHHGLSSGITSRKIVNSNGDVLFNITAQDRNYPTLKTTDGGHTWNMQAADLTALNTGNVRIVISTINHPTGEVSGTFGKISGSQTQPAVPAYPTWVDPHAANEASNSRFLTQTTYGPSPSDMTYVKNNGCRAWLENQLILSPTRNIPYVLQNLSNDPQNSYGSSLIFNSWWRNSITAPDQLRQRAAFALSEILVVSDTGPLNNNGRALADYYDTLLDNCFGNYRDILKQVTLSSAMGVYLDMRGNTKGDIQTAQHPNENYAREILQLFSSGLYRVWPDGSLVLDSTGSAVPTYDQSSITGLARVFTGWTWGQPMVAGRLPTSFGPYTNYLDPMVLVPDRHELGTKVLLDNVKLPAATVTSSSDTSTDPASTYTVQSTDPLLGAGNIVTTTITNQYDLNGVRDLEVTLDNILANSATGPYICRQLIQRLVTSHPKPEYIHRVVRAFNGERNIDGIATGIRGDMKEVFRAILLDPEARSSTSAADTKFGKQREPLLRITGPARAFPAPSFPNSTYRQIGGQSMLVTTATAHRLVSGESVRLSNFTGSSSLPSTQTYSVTATPTYSLVGATGIATINAGGYQTGDTVELQFTSHTLGTTAPYNTLQNYTVVSAAPTSFTIDIANTSLANVTSNSATASTPKNFSVSNNGTASPAYTSIGNTVTVNQSGLAVGDQLYLKFSTGGLASAGFDKVYTVVTTTGSAITATLSSSPADTSGNCLIPRFSGGYRVTTTGGVSSILLQTGANHNLVEGDSVQLKFLVTNQGTPAVSGIYTVSPDPGSNSFRVNAPSVITDGSQGSSGMVVYPLKNSHWTRSGTVEVGLSSWGIGNSDNTLNQTPLDATTVFNFFYPDYRYPGDIATAGMTTPEFQLTNDSNTMTLTNHVTQGTLTNNNSNANGYISAFGSSAVTMDISTHMTAGQTSNAGITGLVDSLGTLLTGGNLSPAAKSIIISYVANDTNFPYTTPTNTEMRNRVRAVIHLIVTSAEYAIQK